MESANSFALGLIGSGIGGSLTPAMHEAEALAQGLNLTYRGIELDAIGAERLPEVLTWARHLGLQGCNITYPVKQAVVPLLDELSPLARRIGAVNTVVIEPGGRLVGHNTDALGFVRSLSQHLAAPASERVVQVGAGGAGSAIAHAMLDWGVAHLTVVDMDAGRASRLADDLARHHGSGRVTTAPDAAGVLGHATGLVNATPVGMHDHPGIPVDPRLLHAGLWVADVVYSPITTRLIAAAAARGCRTIDGSGMAIHQAVEAFEIFTGRVADAARMRTTFEQQLRRRGW